MKLFNLRSILFSIFTLSVSMFTLWLYILFNFNPFDSNYLILTAFYLTLFFTLGGLFYFLIYSLKLNISNNEVIYKLVAPCLRQGYILSFIFVISLILKGLNIFNFFEFIIICIIGGVIELYFRSKNDDRKLPSNN